MNSYILCLAFTISIAIGVLWGYWIKVGILTKWRFLYMASILPYITLTITIGYITSVKLFGEIHYPFVMKYWVTYTEVFTMITFIGYTGVILWMYTMKHMRVEKTETEIILKMTGGTFFDRWVLNKIWKKG
jgi:hypothetical protein